MPSDAFAERILQFVRAKGYRPKQLQELARAMGIGQDEQGDFHAAAGALMRTGRIVLGSRNALTLPAPPGRIVGTYRGNVRGFGFVIPLEPDSHGDLYVPPGQTGGAITGDTVAARVKKRGKRGGKMLFEGQIVEIMRRGQSRFVGELQRQVGRSFVIPDGNTLHTPIAIADVGAKSAKAGDHVVVEITQYPAPGVEARGVIVKVLGKSGEPGIDTASIIEQHQLPGEFEAPVIEEAHRVVEAYDPRKSVEGREDLRKLTIITIDPADARDFDDAISITENRDGTTELGVHIADVAHFVCEGSPLDIEACKRSTSVYLGRTVIPMLPEVLSNGLCSLQERQDRLTKSVFITYDKRGKVKDTRVANTVIRSTKRLTYAQVTSVIEGKRGRISAKVVSLLELMEALARRIRNRRIREGMVVLELPEVELIYDDEGRATDVKPADTSFSHTIIEMFMVEANEAVARLLVSKKIPALRRIHDEPGETAGVSLRRFLGALGHSLPDDFTKSDLQNLLKQVRGKPGSFAVNLAVLRSMQRAEYSPLRIGHYALSSGDYCHFTSPIRRYPDLTIHRLISEYLRTGFKTGADRKRVPTEKKLIELGGQCSTIERRAESAERELRTVTTLRLVQKRVGEKLEGVVTGVVGMGVFVQLDHYLIEGLLRFENLADDWWEVDAQAGSVVGERSGRRITVGDRLVVIIASVDVPSRRIDLALSGKIEKKPTRKTSAKRKTKRRRAPATRKRR